MQGACMHATLYRVYVALSLISPLSHPSFPTSVANRHCEGGQLQAPTPCMNPGNSTWLPFILVTYVLFIILSLPFILILGSERRTWLKKKSISRNYVSE